jgi:hypothetical protein
MTLLTGEAFAEVVVVKTRLEQIMINDKVTSICIFDIVCPVGKQSKVSICYEFAINSRHSVVKTTSYINFSISIIFIAFFIEPILFANVTFEGSLCSG